MQHPQHRFANPCFLRLETVIREKARTEKSEWSKDTAIVKTIAYMCTSVVNSLWIPILRTIPSQHETSQVYDFVFCTLDCRPVYTTVISHVQHRLGVQISTSLQIIRTKSGCVHWDKGKWVYLHTLKSFMLLILSVVCVQNRDKVPQDTSWGPDPPVRLPGDAISQIKAGNKMGNDRKGEIGTARTRITPTEQLAATWARALNAHLQRSCGGTGRSPNTRDLPPAPSKRRISQGRAATVAALWQKSSLARTFAPITAAGTRGWLGPLHHSPSVRNTNDSGSRDSPPVSAIPSEKCAQKAPNSGSQHAPVRCIRFNPHCLCVTPFDAKLVRLTVGYSHSIRRGEGSILTRRRPGARPHLLAATEHLFQPVRVVPAADSGAGSVAVRRGSLSCSVFVHNSAVAGCRRPLTLVAVSAAAAAAAGTWRFQHGRSWRERRGPARPRPPLQGPLISKPRHGPRSFLSPSH